jgi:hypothetical protein
MGVESLSVTQEPVSFWRRSAEQEFEERVELVDDLFVKGFYFALVQLSDRMIVLNDRIADAIDRHDESQAFDAVFWWLFKFLGHWKYKAGQCPYYSLSPESTVLHRIDRG